MNEVIYGNIINPNLGHTESNNCRDVKHTRGFSHVEYACLMFQYFTMKYV